MDRLLAAVNDRLTALGVPTLRAGSSRDAVGGTAATFAPGPWELRTGLLPADRDDALLAASTFYHEARHAEQHFFALGCFASAFPDLLTPENTGVSASRVLRAAGENPPVPGSARYEAARFW